MKLYFGDSRSLGHATAVLVLEYVNMFIKAVSVTFSDCCISRIQEIKREGQVVDSH